MTVADVEVGSQTTHLDPIADVGQRRGRRPRAGNGFQLAVARRPALDAFYSPSPMPRDHNRLAPPKGN